MRVLSGFLCALVVATPLSAQIAPRAYDEGVAARRAGDAVRAATLLEQAIREAPESADARVQLGYALLSLDRLGEADITFAEALRLAPAYDDARIGRALVAERRGAVDQARALIAPVAATNEDANLLRRRIAGTRPPERWTIDVDGSGNHLGRGQPDWRQLDVQLARQISGVRIAGRLEAAKRFGLNDVYAELRGERPVGAGNSVYLLGGATPSADFRPRWQVGAGGRVRASGGAAPTTFTLDARHASYRTGRTTLLNPGVEQYIAGGRASFTFQSINLISDDKLLSGALGRVDVMASHRLRLFGGLANAPDLEQGIVSRTRSLFAGAALEVSPAIALRLSVSRDRPTNGANRIGLSLGTAVHF